MPPQEIQEAQYLEGESLLKKATNKSFGMTWFLVLPEALYTDSAVSCETAGYGMGLIMLGTADGKYAKDAGIRERIAAREIIRGLPEQTDNMVMTLLAEKPFILRYGGVYTLPSHMLALRIMAPFKPLSCCGRVRRFGNGSRTTESETSSLSMSSTHSHYEKIVADKHEDPMACFGTALGQGLIDIAAQHENQSAEPRWHPSSNSSARERTKAKEKAVATANVDSYINSGSIKAAQIDRFVAKSWNPPNANTG
ncbi:hypothetical protein DFH11DRAFT_1548718 [Phellopilus nigrolimitatus]|nr:hypothetical protein DFH11DRAFT_1548718 [Phellopilus nigrolimitatus]